MIALIGAGWQEGIDQPDDPVRMEIETALANGVPVLPVLIGAWLVYNAARPSHRPAWLVPSWLLAFLTTDLAFVHILVAALVTGLFALGGALASLPGKIGPAADVGFQRKRLDPFPTAVGHVENLK